MVDAMSTPPKSPNKPASTEANRRPIQWDALAAIIASLIGFLALLVGGYTAYIQSYTAKIQAQQVRAQVWPYLISGNDDVNHSLTVTNKGAGPAIVRSVQLRIDGKPQADWNHVLAVLDLPPRNFIQTTVNHEVLSPGEELHVIRFPDQHLWQRFHDAAQDRMTMDICFCSTLGECWMSSNGNLIGANSMPLQLRVKPVGQCPRFPATEVFNN